ncbi:MAG: Recombinase [Firmicutes bacterium]|nr:Recombinase [Bacillota bacterium]
MQKKSISIASLEPACFYLRKSREDQEAEERGEGETLAKHRKALFKLAKDYGINVTKIFEEVASGESIIHRPQMLELLKEIEANTWKSVLCMDIDRLGRGGMQDQGLILETFKQAKTKIVTPRKIYDLTDEFDEEYTEFEAFMARKELKIINRRLQSGRLRSIEEGNYLGTYPPYGYLIQYDNQRGRRYLIKNPEQETQTEIIWRLYRCENMGSSKIANELNRLGYVSYTGIKWTGSSVLAILKNPVYAGAITWKKKENKKSTNPNKRREVKTRPIEEQILIPNTHDPYITMEEFKEVQSMLKRKYHPPYQLLNGITNPLAGLIRCDMCGSSMVYRPYTKQAAHLMCYNKHCPNKSSRFEYVEQKLLDGLLLWVENYKQLWNNKPEQKGKTIVNVNGKILQNLRKNLKEFYIQKDSLHDFLEKGVYDIETFLDRSEKISTKIKDTEQAIDETEKLIAATTYNENVKNDIIPKVQHVLDTYSKLDAAKKNQLLKTILAYATYRKEKDQKNDNFTLNIYPITPQ